VHDTLYIAGETVGPDRSGVDGVDANTLVDAYIRHCLVKLSNAILTDPPTVNSADPERAPIPTKLTMHPADSRSGGHAARVILT
jgi:hypothetical protein